ncbi:hypothetical protein NQZ68_037976 [Dissostichus eleginoides]|nr:hypothetical protein NQZ68_037976 [Dissostichus eleginoides]
MNEDINATLQTDTKVRRDVPKVTKREQTGSTVQSGTESDGILGHWAAGRGGGPRKGALMGCGRLAGPAGGPQEALACGLALGRPATAAVRWADRLRERRTSPCGLPSTPPTSHVPSLCTDVPGLGSNKLSGQPGLETPLLTGQACEASGMTLSMGKVQLYHRCSNIHHTTFSCRELQRETIAPPSTPIRSCRFGKKVAERQRQRFFPGARGRRTHHTKEEEGEEGQTRRSLQSDGSDDNNLVHSLGRREEG